MSWYNITLYQADYIYRNNRNNTNDNNKHHWRKITECHFINNENGRVFCSNKLVDVNVIKNYITESLFIDDIANIIFEYFEYHDKHLLNTSLIVDDHNICDKCEDIVTEMKYDVFGTPICEMSYAVPDDPNHTWSFKYSMSGGFRRSYINELGYACCCCQCLEIDISDIYGNNIPQIAIDTFIKNKHCVGCLCELCCCELRRKTGRYAKYEPFFTKSKKLRCDYCISCKYYLEHK